MNGIAGVENASWRDRPRNTCPDNPAAQYLYVWKVARND